MLQKIPSWLKNKYAITMACFIIWVLFFDQNNMLIQSDYRSQLNDIKERKQFYIDEIQKTQQELEELTTNSKTLEKFAREKYFMKKDNEEIFVFVQED